MKLFKLTKSKYQPNTLFKCSYKSPFVFNQQLSFITKIDPDHINNLAIKEMDKIIANKTKAHHAIQFSELYHIFCDVKTLITEIELNEYVTVHQEPISESIDKSSSGPSNSNNNEIFKNESQDILILIIFCALLLLLIWGSFNERQRRNNLYKVRY